MIAAPSPDWHGCNQRFGEPGDGDTRVSPREDQRDDDGRVDQRLGGGQPAKMGSSAARCLQGGEGTHRVSMRGTASLGWRCATVSGDHWGSQGSPMVHEGVIARHMVLPMPARVRTTFAQQAPAWRGPCMRGGRRGVAAVVSRVCGTPLPGGSILVLPPHGRHGPDHPPGPGLAPSGGGEIQGTQGIPLDAVPSPLWRQKWPGQRLTMRRQTGQSQAIPRWVEAGDTRERAGGVTNVPTGEGPAREQRVATERATDVGRPPLARRRIDREAGPRVPDHARSQQRARVDRDTVDVSPGMGRMGPQGFPKGLHRVRSAGVPATKPFAPRKRMRHDAWATGQGRVKGAITLIAPLPSRQRSHQRTGRAPWSCSHCHAERGRWKRGHPTEGVSSDELEGIRRGKEASPALRAGPAGRPGRPFWPASSGISLALPGLR